MQQSPTHLLVYRPERRSRSYLLALETLSCTVLPCAGVGRTEKEADSEELLERRVIFL